MQPRSRVGHLTAAGALAVSVTIALSASAQGPSVDDVVKRAGEAVDRLFSSAAVLLGEERCEQKAYTGNTELGGAAQGFSGPIMQRLDPKGKRSWKAEYAVVRTTDLATTGYPWIEVRDVFESDGKPVHERDDRLAQAVVSSPTWTLATVREISGASVRYQLGGIERVVHTPTVGLLVVHPRNQARFAFTKSGEEKVDGVKTWRIDFREVRSPTLLHSDGEWGAQGALWIDPVTGDVIRSLIAAGTSTGTVNQVTTTYKKDSATGLRLPSDMQENPKAGNAFVEGKCTYTGYKKYETGARLVR